MRLSIVIPVYNVASYLEACLQSVLAQGLTDYEVLLVNDASTDSSEAICREWCKENEAFHLINHTQNKGLSAARNTGIQQSKGQYITFIDSDDIIAPNTLLHNLDCLDNGADVVEYPVHVYYHSAKAYLWQKPDQDITPHEWLSTDGFQHSYAWNKIYRRKLWEGICFPEGKYFEDLMTIPYVLSRAKTIHYSSQGLYYYFLREGSISTTPSLRKTQDYAEALASLLRVPSCRDNQKLHLRALNAQITYRQAGGQKLIIARHHFPWRVIFTPGIGMHGIIKILLHNLHLI